MTLLQTVRRIRKAHDQVKTWDVPTYGAVADHCPPLVLDDGHTTTDWAVAVELARRGHEKPQDAAVRLATHIALHGSACSLARLDNLT